MKNGHLYCDGGARGNPGPAAAAAILYDEHQKIIASNSRYLGAATNNIAEYQGVLIGLALARQGGVECIHLHLDSELVVRQIMGEYKVKHPGLRPLWEQVKRELLHFKQWQVGHIPRSENQEADRLVNKTMDQHFA
jgi:ribonuclease HI